MKSPVGEILNFLCAEKGFELLESNPPKSFIVSDGKTTINLHITNEGITAKINDTVKLFTSDDEFKEFLAKENII